MLKLRQVFNFFLAASLFALVFTTSSIAQNLTEKIGNLTITEEVKEGTRIIISTSGPAEFKSYWFEAPPRLVVEFQTRNIISKIDNEVIVNQGVVKRVTSEYFEEQKGRSLKSLTFELTQKVPYRIWQEADTVILDIQTPQEISVFPEEGKEVFTKNETKEVIIKRLEAMDAALTKVSASDLPLETPKVVTEPPKPRRKGMISAAFWFIGLALISGLGLMFWLFWRRYRLILDKNLATQEITKLKTGLEEKNKLLEHEGLIRKTIENASLTQEKEFKQLKLELQKEAKLSEQEKKLRKTIEEKFLQKEKEYQEAKNSLESLKDLLVEKGYVKKLTSPEEKDAFWIPGESPDKRYSPRLDLTRDYNRTIILRIESQDKSKSAKSFANNIGPEGLCFETRKEFQEKEKISLRLFFFGDRVPILKIKAKVIWKKTDSPVNRYGISFILLEEKDKQELNHYIESKIVGG
ncbi:MAG: PilZ domain-containing protein [Candidatus Omnitrophota bacterium]|nr:PilZ domain-containing protein [Candidatus Omnitrophota bacterium]